MAVKMPNPHNEFCLASGRLTLDKHPVRVALSMAVPTGTADLAIRQSDRLVDARLYPNRSRAIEAAVAEKADRLERRRLARECARLDPKFEQALAEEGLSKAREAWPGY